MTHACIPKQDAQFFCIAPYIYRLHIKDIFCIIQQLEILNIKFLKFIHVGTYRLNSFVLTLNSILLYKCNTTYFSISSID